MHRLNFKQLAVSLFVPVVLVSQASTAQTTGLLNGFVREIAGEHIDYHSFHPYATAALLTRCLDGKRVISWETEPLPPDFKEEWASFAWIAGHSTGSGTADATFRLSVNGEEWFSFTTVKERRVRYWSVTGRHGGTLTFDARWEDNVSDLFGYLYLKVPVAKLPSGKPLLVSVVGDSAGRRDWYMTFKYAMKESVAVQPQLAVLKTPAGNRQLVDVLIDHAAPSGKAVIATSEGDRLTTDLRLGYNPLQFEVAEVKKPKSLTVTVKIEGRDPIEKTVSLRPPTYREFWLLPHSHNDIGYSDLQADVEKKQIKNLRDALDLYRKTASYPPGARFRWNTEILWAVDRFLATCTVNERKDFFATAKKGGIGLNALYTNQLTGICRPEELLRLTEYARTLSKQYGATIDDAMITDIPGCTWATVPALALGGVKYFSSGPNFFPQIPDGGDRVGFFNRSWGDRPFYWVSPSGQEKVLFWVAGKGYSWFHGWMLGKMGENTAWNIMEYLRELDAKQYPYDMVQLRYTIGGDNGPVDPGLPDFVKGWNEKYETPKIIIATASEMFHEFERRWGHALPSYEGDITPYWEDGAVSTLRELGIVRQASERLIQAEAAASILKTPPPDRAALAEAWRNVHLFDEHTWGAHNSVSDPDNPFAVSQWKTKQRYALDCDEQSKRILADALGGSTTGDAIDVVNTASWARSDLVVLDRTASSAGDLVVDGQGQPVPSQRLSDGRLAFLAEGVLPLGTKRFLVKAGKPLQRGSVTANRTELKSERLKLVLDSETGAIRHLVNANGIDFADGTEYPGLNQYLYVPGKTPVERKMNRAVSVELLENGPLVGTLRVVSQAPGCKSLIQEIRIVDGLDRVDISNLLDRERVRTKEAVHVAFPFRVPDGRVRFDGNWGVMRPEADQLPGSCKDYFSVGRWADVSNQHSGITLTITESPLIEVGEMTDETPGPKGYRQWRTTVAAGTTLFSYAMNNYWHTNYMADQEGSATLQFGLHPHGLFNAVDAYKRGVEQNQPLLVRRVESAHAPSPSFLTLSNDGVAVTSVKRSEDGKGTMVRFFAVSGAPEEFTIVWQTPTKMFKSSLVEIRGTPLKGTLTLPAFGIMTLRCEPE